MRYVKRPDILDAVRYGDHETGQWDDQAVARMVAFYLELPNGDLPTQEQIDAVVVRPGAWNPPEEATFYFTDMDGTWLQIGDWMGRDAFGIIRHVPGEQFDLLYAPEGVPGA